MAAILAKRAPTKSKGNMDLVRVLKQLRAKANLVQRIEKLYELAAGGEYGSGLSDMHAKELNKVIEDVEDSLDKFVRTHRRAQARQIASSLKNPSR
jgi:hypothetical protein